MNLQKVFEIQTMIRVAPLLEQDRQDTERGDIRYAGHDDPFNFAHRS